MNIKQMIIPKQFQSGRSLNPKWITIHETDNENVGADANAHARLQARGNERNATWHYQVDDKEIIQSVPDNVDAWAAGDGANGPGNDTSLHIEICVNKDGNFKMACENAAWLARHLMAKHNLGIDKVVQHNKWSGKNCPRHLRAGDKGINWGDFINLVKKEVNHKSYQFVTGGLTSKMIKTLGEFLVSKNWAGHTSSVTIGNFPKDSKMLEEMESWLKKNKWYYTRRPANTNSYYFVTGGLTQKMMLQLGVFLVTKNWSGYTKSVTIGKFPEGSKMLEEMESWLKDRKWYYSKR